MAFTVDVEDYFHAEALRPHCPREAWDTLESRVEANTDRLLSILAARGVQGTFFVLGWVADRHPDLVRRIAAGGHEVASHGQAHELITRQEPAAFREDVRRARARLQELSGQEVLGYRAPCYTVTARTRWALAVLAEEGHRYDSSIFPIRRRRYGIPDAPRVPHRLPAEEGGIAEFPLPTVRGLGVNVPATGGAYLRLLPLAFQERAVRRLLARDMPVALNIHPWELDPDQPRFPVAPRTRWTHYHHLADTERRLGRILDLAPARTMAEVLRELGLLETESRASGVNAG